MDILTKFWKSKSVLITGAGGFIGSHLADELLKRGCKLTALIHYNSRNSWGNLKKQEGLNYDKLKVVLGDINDQFLMRSLTKDIDYVFHLAALIGIPYSYNAPNHYINTNISGSAVLFQSCLENGVKKVIHTSTSEVYGTAKYIPIDEDHPLQAQSPYSASKISADMTAMSYASSFDLPLTILRPFNTYGPKQSARAIIPSVISQAINKKVIEIGDPTPLRDFNYVLDTVNGFICLAENNNTNGEIYNLSSGKQISIMNLVELIRDKINKNISIKSKKQRMRPPESEVMSLLGNSEKLKRDTNWIPKFSFDEGLEHTIKYIRENIDKYKTDRYIV